MPKLNGRQTKKKKKRNDTEDLLRLVGQSMNPDKKALSLDAANLLQDVGRCYTETGRHVGETDGNQLLALIGASSADQAVRAVDMAADPARIAGELCYRVVGRVVCTRSC